jgi:hypothetical protein
MQYDLIEFGFLSTETNQKPDDVADRPAFLGSRPVQEPVETANMSCRHPYDGIATCREMRGIGMANACPAGRTRDDFVPISID